MSFASQLVMAFIIFLAAATICIGLIVLVVGKQQRDADANKDGGKPERLALKVE